YPSCGGPLLPMGGLAVMAQRLVHALDQGVEVLRNGTGECQRHVVEQSILVSLVVLDVIAETDDGLVKIERFDIDAGVVRDQKITFPGKSGEFRYRVLRHVEYQLVVDVAVQVEIERAVSEVMRPVSQDGASRAQEGLQAADFIVRKLVIARALTDGRLAVGWGIKHQLARLTLPADELQGITDIAGQPLFRLGQKIIARKACAPD